MLVEFSSLDDYLLAAEDRRNPPAARRPYPLIEVKKHFDSAVDPKLFLTMNAESATAEAGMREMFRIAQGFPLGRVEIANALVVGENGLIVDLDNRRCWIGFTSGWPKRMAFSFVGMAGFFTRRGASAFEIDTGLLAKALRIERATIVSGPGGNIYGHWLIDVAARLEQMSADSSFDRFTRLLTVRTAPFAQEILAKMAPENNGVVQYSADSVFRVGLLTIYSIPRLNQALDIEICSRAWQMLEAAIGGNGAGESAHRAPGKKLYVSRFGWKKSRFLENGEEVEHFFAAQGWTVVRPEGLSLAEQVSLFRRAEVVVGEDGSGLHNAIFAPPGLTMIVVSMLRTNLHHASIANVKGHRIAYLNAECTTPGQLPDSWRLSVKQLEHTLRTADVL